MSSARAALAMYAFAPIRPSVEQLWTSLRERVSGLAPSLEWDVDLHDLWRDDDLQVSQTCGWPLVTFLSDRVASGAIDVVGAFVYRIPEADGPTYRSVVVARDPNVLDRVDASTAAVNDRSSLSGWVSLRWAAAGGAPEWPGRVFETGSHVESVAAVRDGRADIASIDAVTWRLLEREFPDATRGLYGIAHGPRVPCLPIIAGPALGTDRVGDLRDALVDVVRDERSAPWREVLMIDDFVPLDAVDYAHLLRLAG